MIIRTIHKNKEHYNLIAALFPYIQHQTLESRQIHILQVLFCYWPRDQHILKLTRIREGKNAVIQVRTRDCI